MTSLNILGSYSRSFIPYFTSKKKYASGNKMETRMSSANKVVVLVVTNSTHAYLYQRCIRISSHTIRTWLRGRYITVAQAVLSDSSISNIAPLQENIY